MNLVKWFRKNRNKLLAVLVIIIMFGFIGGSFLSRLARSSSGSLYRTVATYRDGRKVTNYDLLLARQDLEILSNLRISGLLRSNSQDLDAFFLGELLFSDQSLSPMLLGQVKRVIRSSGMRITNKQINDIYRDTGRKDICWFLLTEEAEQAGIEITEDIAGMQLSQLIPSLFPGANFSQVIGSIMSRQGVPESRILSSFSKLMEVLAYAKAIGSYENVTAAELSQLVSKKQETLDAASVQFPAQLYVQEQNEPADEAIAEQFEKYKEFTPGAISAKNPYGFGYKQPDMVQMEYIVVKLSDVAELIAEPKPEEVEAYYAKKREQFARSVPSDANDPNSPKVREQLSYAEVSEQIYRYLISSRKNSKAKAILQEGKDITEAKFSEMDTDFANLSLAEIKENAGDYSEAAKQLKEKYSIEVYSSQTGMLSAADIIRDFYLGMMALSGKGNNPVPLSKVLFAVEQLGSSELGPFDIAAPRIFENIGPVQDSRGELIGLFRIISIRKSSPPDSVGQIFDKRTVKLALSPENTYSVKEQVAEDIKLLRSMKTAENQSKSFSRGIANLGWEETVAEFNRAYKERKKIPLPGEPNAFRVQQLMKLVRIPQEHILTLVAQNEGSSFGITVLNNAKRRQKFIDKLYNLVPSGEQKLKSVPYVMEFKPDLSYYVIKDVSINRIYNQDYQKLKAREAYSQEFIEHQNLSVIRFNPENIIKRTNFVMLKQDNRTKEPNSPSG